MDQGEILQDGKNCSDPTICSSHDDYAYSNDTYADDYYLNYPDFSQVIK